MTNTPSTDLAAARRRQVRAAHAIFAAGDTIATLALFNFARPGSAGAAAALVSPQVTKNAQDQRTA